MNEQTYVSADDSTSALQCDNCGALVTPEGIGRHNSYHLLLTDKIAGLVDVFQEISQAALPGDRSRLLS